MSVSQEVYIVRKSVVDIFDGNHEEYILGIFSTEEKAKKCVSRFKKEDSGEIPSFYSISVFELDSPKGGDIA